jgi:hypothetical protein
MRLIHPGFADTLMVGSMGDDYIDKHILPFTQELVDSPDEIADAIVFMLVNSAVSYGELPRLARAGVAIAAVLKVTADRIADKRPLPLRGRGDRVRLARSEDARLSESGDTHAEMTSAPSRRKRRSCRVGSTVRFRSRAAPTAHSLSCRTSCAGALS